MNSLLKLTVAFFSITLTISASIAQTNETRTIQSNKIAPSKADSTNNFRVEPFGDQQFPVELKLNDSPIIPAVQPNNSAVEELFVPIPAEGYTDENYHINKEKSALQEERMNAIPAPAPAPVDKATRIANYIIERDKYPVNSVEYNQIQEKINVLQGEVE
jgi:hypothetical protein